MDHTGYVQNVGAVVETDVTVSCARSRVCGTIDFVLLAD